MGIYKLYQLGNGLTDSQVAYTDTMKESLSKATAATNESRNAYDAYAEKLGVVLHAQQAAADSFDKIAQQYEETL